MRASWTAWVRRSAGVALGLLLLLPACGDDARSLPTSRQTYDSAGRRLADRPRPERPPNLILVVIGSLRADALPGAERGGPAAPSRMPHLVALARNAVRFDEATAPAPRSLPSMVSLLTGLRPSAHGQFQAHAGGHLAGAITTYAEILQAGYGYETAAYVAGGGLERASANVLQGFATYHASFSLQDLDATVERWDTKRNKTKPYFLLLHAADATEPYGQANHTPPDPPGASSSPDALLGGADAEPVELARAAFLDAGAARTLRHALGHDFVDAVKRYRFRGFAEEPAPELAAELERAYWDGVGWVDRLLAHAVETLEARGLLENTLLVVTADHGVSFGEHGTLGHGLTLHDDVLRVPLVMRGPAPFDRARVIGQSIGLIDVLPTFLDWAKLAPLEGVAGRSALSLVHGGSWCRPVIAEERLTRANTAEDVDAAMFAVRTAAWKYMATFDVLLGSVHEEAYDLSVDPAEQVDVGGGSGRLPEGLDFGRCMCPAIEDIRRRIWGDEAVATDEPYATPYGTRPQRASTARPAPCGPLR